MPPEAKAQELQATVAALQARVRTLEVCFPKGQRGKQTCPPHTARTTVLARTHALTQTCCALCSSTASALEPGQRVQVAPDCAARGGPGHSTGGDQGAVVSGAQAGHHPASAGQPTSQRRRSQVSFACLFVCLYVCVCVRMYLCLCICVHLCLCVSTPVSVSVRPCGSHLILLLLLLLLCFNFPFQLDPTNQHCLAPRSKLECAAHVSDNTQLIFERDEVSLANHTRMHMRSQSTQHVGDRGRKGLHLLTLAPAL